MRHVMGYLLLLAAGLAGYVPQAFATSVCVSTTSQLRTALSTWQAASDQTYTIKIVQGTYIYPNKDYWSQLNYGGNANLQLLGGYTSNCASRSINASNTVIDGEYSSYNSQFQMYAEASVLVEGITFKSFAEHIEIIGRSSDSADSIVVRYVIGTDLNGSVSSQGSFGGFRVLGESYIRVESSLFYNVHGDDTSAGLEVVGFNDNAFAIVDNVTSAYNGTHGLKVSCFQSSGWVQVYNTILFNNTLGDLDTRGTDPDSTVTISYSDFDPNTSVGAFSASGDFKWDPKFLNPLNGDFHLLNNSPAINVGTPEFVVLGGYTSRDLDGGARVVGSLIDLGAYESSVDDLASQTVTTTNDATTGATLRAAIATANANANATTIRFNLAGLCPQVIWLTTPLPDITADTTIDGFSEPGANANTQYFGYDGRICVIVRAANAAVDHALKASGAGRLTLKGIEFEGFSTAAVRLAAGYGNTITGSGFSAVPGAAANGNGVRIEGSANHALIGGLSPGSRNVFDQGVAGVDFEANGLNRANTVQGNFVGFNFDGTLWTGAKMTYGIYLVGSGGNTLSYNTIGGTSANGIRLSGPNTASNTVISNTVGLAPSGDAAGVNNAAIGIAAGAHDNVIGTASYLSQSGGGNELVYNAGPGVWLESTAGNGNRIDGNNIIHDNNGYLPIDLGASTDAFGFGPTANDANDADSGPNRLSNYPYLTQAMRIDADKIALDGYLLPESSAPDQTYRLDVFWTDTCVGSGPNDTPRGEQKQYVGYFFVHVDTGTSFKAYPYTTITAPRTIPGTGYLFATATDGSGNTSEPGKCFPFTDDYIFRDGFGQ